MYIYLKCVFLELSLVNPATERGDKLSPLDVVCVALLTLGTFIPDPLYIKYLVLFLIWVKISWTV